MNRLLVVSLLWFGFHCRADITSEPWPKKLQDFPAEKRVLILRNFKVAIRPPHNQEGRGSGGGMYAFTIQNTHTGAVRRFTEQSVGVAILEFYHGWPHLEIWGRGAGGNWSRDLFRFTRHDYEDVRIDAFTEFDFNARDRTRMTTIPGGGDVLYYVETRLPNPQ